MSNPELFPHNVNTSSSFVTKASRDPNASATRDDAARALQPFAEALQELVNTNRHPYP